MAQKAPIKAMFMWGHAPNSQTRGFEMKKAMELLDERWTMLVIRELILGSKTFNAIRRGVPRMSPARLSKSNSTSSPAVVAKSLVAVRVPDLRAALLAPEPIPWLWLVPFPPPLLFPR